MFPASSIRSPGVPVHRNSEEAEVSQNTNEANRDEGEAENNESNEQEN